MKRIPNRRKPSEFTHPMNISNPRLPCKRCISTKRLLDRYDDVVTFPHSTKEPDVCRDDDRHDERNQ